MNETPTALAYPRRYLQRPLYEETFELLPKILVCRANL